MFFFFCIGLATTWPRLFFLFPSKDFWLLANGFLDTESVTFAAHRKGTLIDLVSKLSRVQVVRSSKLL